MKNKYNNSSSTLASKIHKDQNIMPSSIMQNDIIDDFDDNSDELINDDTALSEEVINSNESQQIDANKENKSMENNNVFLKKVLGKNYRVKIIIGCSALALFFLIVLVLLYPTVGGILELTNNSDVKFPSKNEGGSIGGTGGGSGATPYYEEDGFIYFFQTDYHQYSYGYGQTIASAGCGPTAMAIVLTNLLGKTVTPVEAANFSMNNGHRVEGNGTAWSFFNHFANTYGATCAQMGVDMGAITSSLNSGKLVVLSVGPGHFISAGGHLIVLRKVTADGKILVADPNSAEKTRAAYEPWVFQNEGVQAWICSK